MPLESATYISDLNTSNPVGSTDKVQTLDDHVRLIKSTLKTTFPSVTGAVTATHTELNALDGITATVAELNILDGVTLTAAQINDAARLSVANTFTATQTITASVPSFEWNESDQAANEKIWTARSNGKIFQIGALNDARDTQTNFLRAIRGTGTAIDELELNATTLDFNGACDLSGSLTLGGNLITAGTLTIAGSGETLATFADDGAVTLYYDNASKLNTKTDGVNITGELECDTLDVDGNVAIDGTLTTPNTSASEVGFKGVPANDQNDNYTCVLSDAGKAIKQTGAGKTITIPANASVAFPIGTVLTFVAGNACTIAITSDSLILAGTSTTGSRTLAGNGIATAWKYDATNWIISGTGLS